MRNGRYLFLQSLRLGLKILVLEYSSAFLSLPLRCSEDVIAFISLSRKLSFRNKQTLHGHKSGKQEWKWLEDKCFIVEFCAG